ncbi:MAG: hypothetical protein WA453_11865 [Methyloceanibacter sp.]
MLLGLLAVGTYQNHAEAEKAVSKEASALAGLYRDVSGYPEPFATELRTLIRDYTRLTIEDAWPEQRNGILPEFQAADPVNEVYTRMSQFEPKTEGHQAIHQTALNQIRRIFGSAAVAPVQRYVRHASRHVVHGRPRCAHQHDLRLFAGN